MQTNDYYEMEIITSKHIIVYKLVLDRNTQNHSPVSKNTLKKQIEHDFWIYWHKITLDKFTYH